MDVEHRPEQSRFVTTVDGQESILQYRRMSGDGIEFTSTWVPPALRGRGIAEKLVRTGLAWAREQGHEITTSCWYVGRFLGRDGGR